VDIRIGITQAPREIAIEVEDDAKAREALKKSVDAALKGETTTLWYVEIGSTDAERRIGFGD
jgi:hypothetical protein